MSLCESNFVFIEFVLVNFSTNDWTLDAYSKTSPMKLNNFGFVITNIEAIIVTVTPNLMLNSYFRPKILPSITFIDSEIPSLLKKLETYTNVTYPLESINFIGHPSSSTDIIEIKEGLIIARFVVNKRTQYPLTQHEVKVTNYYFDSFYH